MRSGFYLLAQADGTPDRTGFWQWTDGTVGGGSDPGRWSLLATVVDAPTAAAGRAESVAPANGSTRAPLGFVPRALRGFATAADVTGDRFWLWGGNEHGYHQSTRLVEYLAPRQSGGTPGEGGRDGRMGTWTVLSGAAAALVGSPDPRCGLGLPVPMDEPRHVCNHFVGRPSLASDPTPAMAYDPDGEALYLAISFNSSSRPTTDISVWVYDLSAGTWSLTAPSVASSMMASGHAAGVTVVDMPTPFHIYVVGGQLLLPLTYTDERGPIHAAWALDLASGTWARAPAKALNVRPDPQGTAAMMAVGGEAGPAWTAGGVLLTYAPTVVATVDAVANWGSAFVTLPRDTPGLSVAPRSSPRPRDAPLKPLSIDRFSAVAADGWAAADASPVVVAERRSVPAAEMVAEGPSAVPGMRLAALTGEGALVDPARPRGGPTVGYLYGGDAVTDGPSVRRGDLWRVALHAPVGDVFWPTEEGGGGGGLRRL